MSHDEQREEWGGTSCVRANKPNSKPTQDQRRKIGIHSNSGDRNANVEQKPRRKTSFRNASPTQNTERNNARRCCIELKANSDMVMNME